MITTKTLRGTELDAALPDVARLRIEVFRDFPYLYDGDVEYEQEYLQPYRQNDQAIVIGAYANGEMVGAATGTPLLQHDEKFSGAFEDHGVDPNDVFYNAESVLRTEWRGRGIGHVFFDLREAHARALGFSKVAFCGVVRPENHPAREPDYRGLEPFWRKRGYAPMIGVTAGYDWLDIGEQKQTTKTMQFWIRHLD